MLLRKIPMLSVERHYVDIAFRLKTPEMGSVRVFIEPNRTGFGLVRNQTGPISEKHFVDGIFRRIITVVLLIFSPSG